MVTPSFANRAARQQDRRQWRFGGVCFDETTWVLSVDGSPVQLEAKPVSVLHELLRRYGEVITKDELLDAVWCDQKEPAAEASLTTAVFKLRKALGDDAARQVKTVPKIGYRLVGPVTFEQVLLPVAPLFVWQESEPVPRRPGWFLVEPVGSSAHVSAWRARHASSGETRIFRFAETPAGLQALRREVAIAQRLAEATSGPSPCADLLEWSFDEPPFFVEITDVGLNLLEWAEARSGLRAVPIAERLAIMRDLARVLAAAHGAGIVHGDIGPMSIRIARNQAPVLVNFASHIADAHPAVPFTDDDDFVPSGDGASTATPYTAPELHAGGRPTTLADIYSLGILLYQVAIGNLSAPLAPGWEQEVGDPFLADDIARAAAGEPSRRLKNAADLAERLECLDNRRHAADEARIAADGAALAAEKERRRQARAPWVRAAAVILVIGLATSSIALVEVINARDAAERERRVATAAYDFLSKDLLARVSPAEADAANETLTQAVLRTRSEIDRRFAHQPVLAGRLHATLAGAFHQRSQWDDARQSHLMADAAFRRAGPTAAAEAAENRMTLASTEAASAQPGSRERAIALIAAEKNNPFAQKGAAGVKLEQARGLLAYFGDPQDAPAHFARAAALAQALPDEFTLVERLQLRQAAAMALVRNGRAAQAEPELRMVADDIARLEGPSNPSALLARASAITAALLSGRYQEASSGATRLLPLMEKRFGADHRFTLAALSIRSQALGAQGHFDAAAEDAARAWKSALEREGTGQQAQIGELDLAHYLCRAGRSGEGLSHAMSALSEVRQQNGVGHSLAHTASFTVGECLAAAGQPGKALAIYRTVDADAVGRQVGDGNWIPNLQLAIAEAYLAAGRRDQARRAIDRVGKSFEKPNADIVQRTRTRRARQDLGLMPCQQTCI